LNVGNKRGRGAGNRSNAGNKIGRGQRRSVGDREESSGQRGRPVKKERKPIEKKIHYAKRAYQQNTNPKIKRFIQNMEEESLQAQSDLEMEDWEFLLHDPGNTKGRMSLFKQSLHMYWVMKRLMAKALEQVAIEMAELAQGVPNLRRELRIIHITLEKQEKKLDDIQ